jgi:hypothetical protein
MTQTEVHIVSMCNGLGCQNTPKRRLKPLEVLGAVSDRERGNHRSAGAVEDHWTAWPEIHSLD